MRIALLATALAAATAAHATVLPLYTAALGTSPIAQGWLNGLSTGGTVSSSTDGTRVDTLGSNAFYSGYANYNYGVSFVPPDIFPTTPFNPAFPTLDRTAGFALEFTVRVDQQVNDGANGPDRAGFSVTLLSSDLFGIELAFARSATASASAIFAQSSDPLFTAAESTSSPGQNPLGLDVDALLGASTTYRLTILGGSFSLTTGTSSLLTGSVRTYAASTGFGTAAYDTPSFVFLGDNTSSARADFLLGDVSLVPVPEPSTYAAVLGAGVLALALARRRAGATRR